MHVYSQDADIAAADITVTKERFDVVDFTTSFVEDSRAFVTKKPTEHKIMIYLNAFQVCEECNCLLLRSLFKQKFDQKQLLEYC